MQCSVEFQISRCCDQNNHIQRKEKNYYSAYSGGGSDDGGGEWEQKKSSSKRIRIDACRCSAAMIFPWLTMKFGRNVYQSIMIYTYLFTICIPSASR